MGALPGPRPQSNLRMAKMEPIAFAGAEIVQVISVDYKRSRVEVYNSNGSRWARVLIKKTSGILAGENDMPNVDDWGAVMPVNGDFKSAIWLGCLNTVEDTENLVNDENYPGSDAGLVHRSYKKHETGSFSILDKLGNLLMTWYKKATRETDAALKNLTVSIQGGVITITHFRANPSVKGLELVSDQNGNVNVTNYQADGSAVAARAVVDNSGGMTISNTGGATIQFASNGDITLRNNGVTITIAASGTVTINGTMISLGSGTLSPLVKAAILAIFNAHVHTSAAPGQPTTPPLTPMVPGPTLITTKVEAA